MKVLMIGATGQFASLVVPELKKRGTTVYALVKDKNQAAKALEKGADETVIGNLNDFESLLEASKGMEGVFHINPAFAPHEAEMGVAMVAAAKSAGVKKIVFSGVYHPSLSMINHAAKRPVEEALYNSGIDFTILQPAMYMQNLKAAFNDIKKHGKIAIPYSKLAKMCYVDYRDVAEAAAIAMTEDTLSYGTFELCSRGMYNQEELAAIMTGALGKPIQVDELSPADWAQQAQIPDGLLKEGLMAMNEHYNKYGFSGGNALVLKTILGREPKTLQAYIGELAAG